MKYTKIPIDVSVHIRYLHQDLGLNLTELCQRYPQYPKTSIYRHSKLKIGEVNKILTHLHYNRN